MVSMLQLCIVGINKINIFRTAVEISKKNTAMGKKYFSNSYKIKFIIDL